MSNALDRIRDHAGSNTTKRRHITEETPSLEEVTEPNDGRDDRKTYLREWVAENPWPTLGLTVIGLVVAILLIQLVMRYSPAVLNSPWTYRLLVGGLLIGGTYYSGVTTALSRFKGYDMLTVRKSTNSAKRYFGYHFESDIGDYQLFVPIAGWTWLGHRDDVYRIKDISRQIIHKRGSHWQEDDPAVMRLDPDWTAVDHGPLGTVVTTTTAADGFEPFDGQESNLRPVTPEEGEKERIKDMKQTLEDKTEDVEYYKELAQKLRRQRDNALDEIDKPVDEIIDERVKFYQDIREYDDSARRNSDGQTKGMAPTPSVSEELNGSGDDA